ncbi:actin cytoskeleton-regulatory complex protein PAN1-like [Punica granatum]|uniref:Uncharacterized protein n=2 Tax=Punica granatum TaxID=22663 RepID=A0A218XGH3_PUNGR|nr:actin cytoskeleton-regulatory complex protein PAN1-like [Punica granatum]OWM84024.1 hypothetical protein CDL15_Pgr004455 [Punica granatum]PKI75772.1 hypothetical protein CRG98_003815 [Punica granatum]
MASAQNQAPSADLFDSYFRRADLDRDGRISGAEAVSFFLGSGLPKPVLAKIWDYADQNRTGFLGRPEFYNALKLVTVAQSKRELTPEIVKAALYGPTAAQIPAPRINLAAVPAPQLSTAGSAPAARPGAVAPMPSQSVGYRGPPVPTNSNLTQQHFSPQGSQLVRPPQAASASSSQPTHIIPAQGFSGAGGAVRPNSSGVAGDWSTGALSVPSSGSMPQVPNRGFGPSATQSGPEFALTAPKASLPPRPQAPSGMIPPKPPVKDAKQQDISRNGFASDSIFGSDVFSASQSQPRQGSATGNAPSSAMQPPASTNGFDSLQSKYAMQPGGSQQQPAHAPVKQGAQGPNLTPSSLPSSGNSQVSQNYTSSQSQIPWPKMTQTDVQKYMKVFVEVDTDKDGKISGEQARNLFLSWRLPREVLKQVWDLSDQDNDSMLSLREFCIALYLMERQREGHPLPSVLPSNIVFDFPAGNQPAMGYTSAGWGPTSGFQQKQVMHGQHTPTATRGRPPLPPGSGPSVDGETQASQKKSKVPVLEKHLVDQLSKEEQNSLNTRFQEAMDADNKVEELEKDILESKEKIEFYRAKMQELVLYKSRCDNRLNEIMERIAGDKREVEVLAKKYEEKYRQTGDVASRLTLEEATFRDIQEKKMDLYRAILGMDKDGDADGTVKDHANRIQSDLDDLVKSLNERCKSYGLRAKPTSLVELPFGWQPGIQATAADWDEDWDKFEDEGFTFVKELTLDVQNVVAPPKEKSKPTPQDETGKVEESPKSPTASPHAEDAKSEKPSSVDEHGVVENGVHHDKSKTGESPRSAPGSPRARSSIGSAPPKEDFPDSGFGKTTSAETSVSFDKEKPSDHEAAESVFSGDKSFDEPSWGTFANDDVDSVWGFNAVSKETDNDKLKDDYFIGGLNPIRTSAEPNFQRRSIFDESVPSTPMTNAGFSPTYNKEGVSGPGPFFDSSFRSDSFNIHDGGLFPQRETFSRFDSMRSTKDYDLGHGFPSFDDSDPFGSGPFKTSFGETPRRGSDIWSETPRNVVNFGETPRSTYNFGETPRGTYNFGETPRGTYNFAETPKSTYNFAETPRSTYNWGETPRKSSEPWGETSTRASDNWGETPRSSDNWGETPRSSDPWGETPKKGSDNWRAF